MTRLIPGLLFALCTAATASTLVEGVADAITDSSGRTWLLAGYWFLKTLIVGVFAFMMFVRGPAKRPAREPKAFLACAVAIVSVVVLGAPGDGATSAILFGEVLATASCVFLLWAVLTLGRSFSVLPEARELVTRGPYKLVRHPVYLGEFGAAFGLLAGALSVRNVLAMTALTGAQLVRMRMEEAALAREFPEYEDYAKRTPRLLPRLEPPKEVVEALEVPVDRRIPMLLAFVIATLALLAARAALADAATLSAPRLSSPANAVSARALPPLAWKPVSKAAKYEFQLSADRAFESLVGGASQMVANTYATTDKALADGDYYWRVRALDAKAKAGRWSAVRHVSKRWTDVPALLGPAVGETVTTPTTPLVLRWGTVPGATRYRVDIATDPSMASSAINGAVETSATVFTPGTQIPPGRYYWNVTPLDAQNHSGARSATGSFDLVWPTTTATRLNDLVTDGDPENRVFDPSFEWDPIPGAVSYEVEVNPADDWAVGSKVCCTDLATGTTLSPLALLPNNTYHWRVRARDADGNAGLWNVGPDFKKGFDDVAAPLATVTGLRVRDNLVDGPPALGASGYPETDSPVVAWEPVPGASSYEVQVAPWEGFCNWTATSAARPTAKNFVTATTAWTPLGPLTLARPLGDAWGTATNDLFWGLAAGTDYCVRVRARSDRDAKSALIVSDWTQIGGLGSRAFSFKAFACKGNGANLATPASAYQGPQTGSVTPRMPLFTWQRVDGACSYFVVVARDAEFTKIIDVAITNVPAYAPRAVGAALSYTDENTSYYWAVLPAPTMNGDGVGTQPQQNAPQNFQKRSVPPALLSPANGSDIAGQPSLRWTPAEGALDYRVQVDDDPTFGSPIDDVVTHSTGFTAMKAYPADTVLYWRVRADAENGFAALTSVGLTWSATGTFRRRLPVPVQAADTPQSGETIPLLRWTPVQGAAAYDFHVEQVDGTKKDFTVRAAALTPTKFYGTGVWRWQVRAAFPSGYSKVPGPYSPMMPFTRHIATPTRLQVARDGGGALLTWQPAVMARQYKVQVSNSDSFSTIIEQSVVDGTSFAPKMTALQYAVDGPLYWRVAAVDEGNNTGGWAAAPLRSPLTLRVKVSGQLRHGRSSTIRVKVTDARGRALRGAAVKVTGTGVTAKSRLSARNGRAALRVKTQRKGRAVLEVSRRGYATRTVNLRVR